MMVDICGAVKVAIVGECNVGKSWIVNRFLGYSLTSFTACGMNLYRRIILTKDGKNYMMHLTDFPGHYKPICSVYAKFSAVLVVFDLTDSRSFNNATSDWLYHIRDTNDDVIIILVGNKCDCDTNERAVSNERVKILCDESDDDGLLYYEVSAKENINIDLLFQDVLEMFKNCFSVV